MRYLVVAVVLGAVAAAVFVALGAPSWVAIGAWSTVFALTPISLAKVVPSRGSEASSTQT